MIKYFKDKKDIYHGDKDTKLSSCAEADATGVNSRVNETKTTQEEAKKMYMSVKKYGGFYVGRYEAGKEKINEVETVVVKKGVEPYSGILWSANGNMQETEDTTGGAVEISRNFGKSNNYKSVTSTLIYGVQWDAIMNFIDSNYITNATIGKPQCNDESFVKNSTNHGWYDKETSTTCGSNDDYRVKNVYDLAGNLKEWTMESTNTSVRVNRGGDYGNSGQSESCI